MVWGSADRRPVPARPAPAGPSPPPAATIHRSGQPRNVPADSDSRRAHQGLRTKTEGRPPQGRRPALCRGAAYEIEGEIVRTKGAVGTHDERGQLVDPNRTFERVCDLR